jgi:hypothetical protein
MKFPQLLTNAFFSFLHNALFVISSVGHAFRGCTVLFDRHESKLYWPCGFQFRYSNTKFNRNSLSSFGD